MPAVLTTAAEARQSIGAGREVTRDDYKEFKGVNVVRLVIMTTPPAEDQTEDVENMKYPFGLLDKMIV